MGSHPSGHTRRCLLWPGSCFLNGVHKSQCLLDLGRLALRWGKSFRPPQNRPSDRLEQLSYQECQQLLWTWGFVSRFLFPKASFLLCDFSATLDSGITAPLHGFSASSNPLYSQACRVHPPSPTSVPLLTPLSDVCLHKVPFVGVPVLPGSLFRHKVLASYPLPQLQ